jgi:histidinol-phosphate aminotransferase
VIPVPARADLRFDLDAMASAAHEVSARLVWVADPNNPTGLILGAEEWLAFLEALPEGCVAVVDEAYVEYVSPELRLHRERDVAAGRPVLVLRTFSKIFGLAGLRLGYAIASEELAWYLNVVQEPFNVNRAALAAGRASLRDPAAIDDRRRLAAEARELLTRRLGEAGMEALPSEANFVFVRVGVDDTRLTDLLARRGLLIRPGSEFGLDGFVRITVGPLPIMERVAAELARARAELRSAEGG